MNKSESIAKLTEALCKVQRELQSARKGSTNPYFNSKYADLSAVWDVCRQPLADNSLAVCQVMKNTESGLSLETILLHTSGEWISGEMAIHPVKSEPQAIGSAITYARRYQLAAILGVTVEDDDDDGEAAMARSGKNGNKKSDKQDNAGKQPADPVTPDQVRKLGIICKERDIVEETHQVIIDRYGKKSRTDLTKAEASELIRDIEAGKITRKPVTSESESLF